MLIVSTKPAEPEWTPVMGASVLFAPIDRTMVLRAKRAVRDVAAAEPQDSTRSSADLIEEMGDALSRVLILEGARDWRDVVSETEGDNGAVTSEPLAFSRETLERAIADPITFDAFDAAYVQPFLARERQREAPGKDSPRSPDGTGTKEQEVQTIATSPAPATAADATSAPIGSTKRKAPKKRTSGAS